MCKHHHQAKTQTLCEAVKISFKLLVLEGAAEGLQWSASGRDVTD